MREIIRASNPDIDPDPLKINLKRKVFTQEREKLNYKDFKRWMSLIKDSGPIRQQTANIPPSMADEYKEQGRGMNNM